MTRNEITVTAAVSTATTMSASRKFDPRDAAISGSTTASVLSSPEGVVNGVSTSVPTTGGAPESAPPRAVSISSSGETSIVVEGEPAPAEGCDVACVNSNSQTGTAAAFPTITGNPRTLCRVLPDLDLTMWTVLRLLESSTALLTERGSPSPKADAQLLLGHALGMSKTDLYINAQRPVDEAEREAFRDLVKRRAATEPVAYILGTAGFWSLDLAVDPRVLIPRPETEHVVELALAFTKQFHHTAWRIVDVGTGSGALALALAAELPDATVLAIDVSADALEVAKENAESCGLRERVRFAQGDVLSPLGGRDGVVDIVVSNPPYVAEDDPDLESGVRAFEPHVALFAADDGLSVVSTLVNRAAHSLVPGGLLLVEHGRSQGPSTRALAERAGLVEVRTSRDYGSRDRVLSARRAGPAPWEAVASSAEDDEPEERAAEPEEKTDGQRMMDEALEIGLPLVSLDE